MLVAAPFLYTLHWVTQCIDLMEYAMVVSIQLSYCMCVADYFRTFNHIVQNGRAFNHQLFARFVEYTKAFCWRFDTGSYGKSGDTGISVRMMSSMHAIYSELQIARRKHSGTTQHFDLFFAKE